MAEKKKPNPIYTSPIGFAQKWAKVVTPDDYQGQRKYKINMAFDAEDAEKITGKTYEAAVKEAEKLYALAKDAAKKKGKPLPAFSQAEPFFSEIDTESGEETGRVVFKFGSNAEYEDKKTGETKKLYVAHFTASGKAIPQSEKKEPWAGSRLRIAYSLIPYCNVGAKNYGVSLRLQAIKVIELVQGGSGSENADRYGFGDEEEGYEGESGGAAENGMGDDESADEDEGDAPAF